MSTPSFRFRQFTVWHDRCAMKVGTDGVLLGAWTALPNETRVRALDIGVGSGLIALMIAQRLSEQTNDFHITGIDIDEQSVEQARENIALSPWAEKIEVQTEALQTFMPGEQYELIVSNPPFFVDSLRCPDVHRSAARHTDMLPYGELIKDAARLLTKKGLFSMIAPAEMEETLKTIGTQERLQVKRITRFAAAPEKAVKRVLMTFCRSAQADSQSAEADVMTMADETYKTMVKGFYL